MPSQETSIFGTLYVVGDNIDTDQIIPAKYLNLVPTIPEEYRALGSHALSGLPDTYPPFVPPGHEKSPYTIIIAGRNFGCGSSREHAPIALAAAGVRAVIAQSYARLFFRNAVATGELFPLESDERLCETLQTGQRVQLDIDAALLTELATGRPFRLKPLGALAPVIRAGGLFAYARATGMIASASDKPHPEKKALATASDAPTSIPSPPPVQHGTPKATRVIAIANQKGGVGKTTTVINLAACLARLGRICLIVDMDPQANATSGVGISPERGYSLYNALLGNASSDALVRNTAWDNLDILPSEIGLAAAEIELGQQEGYRHRLRAALSPIVQSGRYDFVFVDCPPSLGLLALNGLTAAQSVIIPIQCEYYALEGLSVIVQLLDQLAAHEPHGSVEIEGILMTMHDGRTRLADQVVGEVRRHFGDRVYRTVIPRNIRLSEAPSHGCPVIHYDAHSVGAAAYRRLAREFLDRYEKRGSPAASPLSRLNAVHNAEGPGPIASAEPRSRDQSKGHRSDDPPHVE